MGSTAANIDEPLDAARIRASLARLVGWLARGGVPFVTIAGGALASGATDATSWGWIAFGLFAVAGVAALAAPVQLGWADGMLLVGLGGLLALSAASSQWSDDVSRTWLATERAGVDVAIVLAVILVASRATAAIVLGGVWAASAVIAVYALLHRLYPLRFGITDVAAATGYRLADPFPYWNMLAALSAVGILVGLGIAARATHMLARAAAAASLVPLSLALYFTYSRGTVAALAVTFLVVVALESRRVQLAGVALILSVPSVAALVIASRMHGLTSPTTTLNEAAHDGRLLALIGAVLSFLTAFLLAVIVAAERRRSMSTRLRVILGSILVLAVAAVGAVVVIRKGGPASAWNAAVASYRGPASSGSTDLNDRMWSLSSNGRSDLWTVARAMAASAPLKGRGAGTFEGYWMEHRPTALETPYAHDAYLQLLAELGPGALVLLGIAIVGVLVAAIRARRTPLALIAFGGFLLVLVHAVVDTDFESPPVMLAALTCAGVAVACARTQPDEDVDDDPPPGRWAVRVLLLLVAVAGTGGAAYALRGSTAIDSASANVVAGKPCAALQDARTATVRVPWMADAWREVGAVDELLGDTDGAANAYREAIRRSPTDLRLRLDLVGVTRGDLRATAAGALMEADPIDGAARVAGAPLPGNVTRTVCG